MGEVEVVADRRSVASSPDASFDAFYAAEYEGTLRVVYALCGSWVVAEEVAQDAFVKVLRRWADVAAMQQPGAWVRRVACNAATSRFRRRSAEARALARLGARRGRPPDRVASPEVDDAFWRLVRRLPRRQAITVALHYGDDLSVRDVARVMDVAEGTVKSHLHAARAALAVLLAGPDEEETR